MTFQSDLNVLFQAIREKRTVILTYRDDPDPRKFEPYAVFPRTSQANGLRYFVDGRQWCGYSESNLSQWKYRQLVVSDIKPGVVLGDPIKQSTAPYDPTSSLYDKALVKREV